MKHPKLSLITALTILLFSFNCFYHEIHTGRSTLTGNNSNYFVLVWSANDAYHIEVELFKGNASDWGYTVLNSTATMTSDLLIGIDILIVNGPDYIYPYETEVIKTWFTEDSDRTLWIAGESDYGGYWSPAGTSTTPTGVNHLIKELGGHLYIQDDAVSDPISMDGASYRVLASVPNTDAAPAKFITRDVTHVSMHGPTAVIPYSSVTADGVGTVGSFKDMNKVQWVISSSKTGSIQDQDFDDDAK